MLNITQINDILSLASKPAKPTADAGQVLAFNVFGANPLLLPHIAAAIPVLIEALADGKLDPQEIVRLAAALGTPGSALMAVAVELADEAIKATADDGRIDMAEAAAILQKLVAKLPELKGK